MASAITVSGVGKRYGGFQALDGIELDVSAGSIFGLVGPNGAGKTTLIRILVGALGADTGSVSVMGLDPSSEEDRVRSVIGYMPQDSVLYSDLTARENVAFFYRGHQGDGLEEAVTKALDFTDLSNLADRPVHTLSGGVRQRVSLAIALAHQPQILLLDEPTAGVDPELRHAFWEGFKGLAREGATIFISTHQMDEVVHCDRVALLRRGRILTEAPPSELIASGGARIQIREGGKTSSYQVRSAPEELPRILHGKGLDATIDRIEVGAATLEEVILELVEHGARS